MANARSKRTHVCDNKLWSNHYDESLKLIDWYGREHCRRFKSKSDCACGGHSRNNKKLWRNGPYMKYSYRLLRRAAERRRRGIPEPLD